MNQVHQNTASLGKTTGDPSYIEEEEAEAGENVSEEREEREEVRNFSRRKRKETTHLYLDRE